MTFQSTLEMQIGFLVTFFKLYSPNIVLDHYVKVEDLIDQRHHTWNKNALDHICIQANRNRILQITLSSIPNQDRLVLLPNQDGKFSVKRAYYFINYISSLSKDDPRSSKATITIQGFWKHICHYQTIPRQDLGLASFFK